MTEHSEGSRGTHFLVAAAALVVVVAGLKAASGILLPFVVAVCLAVLAAPPMFWLRRWGLPSPLAVFVVVTALAAAVAFAGVFVAGSFNQLLAELPRYELQLQRELDRLGGWLRSRGLQTSPDFFGSLLDPEGVPGVIASLLASVGEILTDAVLVLLLLIFILLEASSFPVKIRRVFRRPEVTLEGFAEFAAKLNRYIAVKTLISVATAVAVGGWTWLLGVEFPFLWAVLAFLLNYIPTLGSIFAAVPPVLLGWLQQGPGFAVLVALGYFIINFTLGSLLEPRFLGHGLGLSPLIVFLSLVVWAWILGPVGMLVAVPLTMTLKIALQSSERTRWVAILLGPELPPPTSGQSATAWASANSQPVGGGEKR
jgi:AI-2 transport protein TqsA